jgi:hypothetical protein
MRKNILLLTLTLFWAFSAFAGGGPDAYGYTWLSSNDPGGPAYNWIDITTIGTEISGMADDNVVGPFSMGIDFQFYWIKRNEVFIGSNGYVAFQNINIASTSIGFPSTPTADANNELVAAMMTDLNYAGPGNPGKVYTYTDVAAQKFIVSCINVPFWLAANPSGYGGSNTFQYIFDATDSTITLNYQAQSGSWNPSYDASMNPCVVGIENVSGSIGLMVSNNQLPVANTAVKFYAPPAALIDVPDVEPSFVQNPESGGFFVIKQGSNSLNATIGNVGNVDITTNTTVNASVQDSNGNTVYIVNETVAAPFVAGSTELLNFSIPFSPPLSGPYSYTVTVSNATDINGLNDAKTVEVSSVDTTGGEAVFQFVSDNGTNLQNANGGGIIGFGVGEGAGVYMRPYGYPIILKQIELGLVNIGTAAGFHIPAPGDTVCKLTLYNDAGGTVPGQLLYEHYVLGSEVMLPNGNTALFGLWTTIDLPVSPPILITEGGFYMGYQQLDDSVFLFTEEAAPISRRSYEILSDTWAVYRTNSIEDLWIRAVADISLASTGIKEELSNIRAFNVYPNPTDGRITVDLSLDNISNVTLRVYNPLGAKVYLENVGNVSEFTKEVDLSGLSSGLYFIEVESPQGKEARRIMVR